MPLPTRAGALCCLHPGAPAPRQAEAAGHRRAGDRAVLAPDPTPTGRLRARAAPACAARHGAGQQLGRQMRHGAARPCGRRVRALPVPHANRATRGVCSSAAIVPLTWRFVLDPDMLRVALGGTRARGGTRNEKLRGDILPHPS